MVLVIDNFDSFTYNIVQYLQKLNSVVLVKRNNSISLDEIAALNPKHIVISPGPNTPNEAGISLEVIRQFYGKIPILGVCLGHQAIAAAFGANIVRAKQPIHGKTSVITHSAQGVFSNLPKKFQVTRYHSLVIAEKTLPEDFIITAWTEDAEGNLDEIMGIKHKQFALEGVQFHPESILSEHGLTIFNNFLGSH
ncbi:anthranilate synthase component II [Thorsellia kenyensis]|uniref:Anthranilate synthase component II n=1 Tax=Thorsellia kenyensis TaxID=1549888 RepID=A0ABV6C8T1_9GAMM